MALVSPAVHCFTCCFRALSQRSDLARAISSGGDHSTVIIDVTAVNRMAVTNRKAAREGIGKVALAAEAKKLVATPDSAVARINGHQYLGLAIERDTLTLGPGLTKFIERMSRQNLGRDFDGDLYRLFGYRKGIWSTPSAAAFWKACVVRDVLVAREQALAIVFARTVYAAGN